MHESHACQLIDKNALAFACQFLVRGSPANGSLFQTACKFDSIKKKRVTSTMLHVERTVVEVSFNRNSWAIFCNLQESLDILQDIILKSSELLQTSLAMFGNDWDIIGKSK